MNKAKADRVSYVVVVVEPGRTTTITKEKLVLK
jgi:hypothetical protein